MKARKKISKVRNYKMVSAAMHVIECPECGAIAASASEKSLLPDWATCRKCSPAMRTTADIRKMQNS